MRIIVDMWHPADVHFFKNFIWAMRNKGHRVEIAAREKDVTTSLLDGYGFAYTRLSKKSKGLARLALEMLVHDSRLYRMAKDFRPDLMMAFGGISISHVGRLLRIPSLGFYDSEFATWVKRVSFPFLTKICTPSAYREDLGAKQVRFDSYKELAYLHPDHFVPDLSVFERLGLERGETFFILRLISFDSSHDIGLAGIGLEAKRDLISLLERHGKLFITSETMDIPPDFRKRLLKTKPADLVHALAFASLVVSEGTTTASEAAVLGVPVIYINRYSSGNTDEEIGTYGLMKHILDGKELLLETENMLACRDLRAVWQQRRAKLLADKKNLAEWMVEYVESAAFRGPRRS
jgi:uncharacterized protein